MDKMRRAISDVLRACRLWHVWLYQAYYSISAKYRRSVLGPFWIAGSTVATSVALAVVFGGIFGQPIRIILPYIMSGILTWAVVSAPITEAPEALVGNAGIIKSHNFPYTYYVFELVTKNLLFFLHNLVVYFAVQLILGSWHLWHWSVLLTLPFVAGIVTIYSMPVAMLAARYKDVRFLFPYLSQLFFFASPIFWKAESLPPARAAIVYWNPFYHLMNVVRQPLLGNPPPVADIEACGLILVIGLAVWFLSFPTYRNRIPFWI